MAKVRARVPRALPRKKSSKAPAVLASLIALAAVFGLGRWSASFAGLSSTGEPETKTASVAQELPKDCPPPPLSTGNIGTSTIGLCPCPRPRPQPAVGIKRKIKPPVETPPHELPDPTAATARYLKERAQELGVCAPKAGGEVRVHLEVTVVPKGAIEKVRITNLDPLPPGVSACVHKTILAFTPPGFDASRPETFALTVVL